MPDNTIAIDEIRVPSSAGRPLAFVGVHSGTELSGIDMEITVYTNAEFNNIEQLFQKETVMVEDPFVGRQYEATLVRKSYSYQEGRPERLYHFEVKELDEAIPFEFWKLKVKRSQSSRTPSSYSKRAKSACMSYCACLQKNS